MHNVGHPPFCSRLSYCGMFLNAFSEMIFLIAFNNVLFPQLQEDEQN